MAALFSSAGATLFNDNFESGVLGPAWSVSATFDGRVSVSTNFSPASGQWAMVLDDSVNDAVYSVAECTLQLDLSKKKNVVLSFKAKSLGNEPDYGYGSTREFDGVSVSRDAGATWNPVGSLAYVGSEWTTFSVGLDYFAGYGHQFGSDFRIRFSEYDNASAPLDGIAIDDVLVTGEDDQRMALELPSSVTEGTGPHTGYVLLSFPPTNELTLTLSASPSNQIVLPTTVTVPAGQTMAAFQFSVSDDTLLNLTRTVLINASAPGVGSDGRNLTILDDDRPVVTWIMPAQLSEGAYSNNNARVIFDRAPEVDFDLYFADMPSGQIEFSYWVTIPAGQTQTVFSVNAYDDNFIEGNMPVTLYLMGDGRTLATNQVVVLDNETRNLSLILPPTVREGSIGSGTVVLSGILPTNLIVKLVSSNTTALTVPTTVTVVAGETQASFPLTAVDNLIADGSHLVYLSASEGSFSGTSGSVIVRDNEVASYHFGALSNIVSSPLEVQVSAADVEGNPIGDFTGSVTLSLMLPGGISIPVTPASVSLSGDVGWKGIVTLPPVNASPLQLRATDGSGRSGYSEPFDLMRLVNLPADCLVWDSFRQKLYASIPAGAGGTNANRVVVIDPISGQISGSIITGQDPGKLVLTSGGEDLYVALNANGTVARINPDTLSVASTFAIGNSPGYGTLYVDDMCAVTGQPDLLVVSQKRLSVSPRHNGVAVYDNGVIRPVKTQDHTGSNMIEPSADPNIFFGYNTESSENGFRRLQLSASGMTEIEVERDLLPYATDMRSDGNLVFSQGGAVVDGAFMRRLGIFPVTGEVCPDLAVNRVFFLEPEDYYWYDGYDRIGAYDPETFSNIRTLTLSTPMTDPSNFIHWGTNGLAFIAENELVLITSSRLVPTDPPANLAVSMQAAPNPAMVSAPVTYTICVSNQGPNIASGTLLTATLSSNQTFQSYFTTNGTPVVATGKIFLNVGQLPPSGVAILTLTTIPQSAGLVSCSASATSEAVDTDYSNNSTATFVSVGFQSAIDVVNRLRLPANNLVYDPTRNLLWATIPATEDPPLGRTLVSINPLTGLILNPIPLSGDPAAQCMALSGNGRYLYIGLSDSPEMLRLDLQSNFAPVRIPLTLNSYGYPGYPKDVAPLDGDGTSFMVTLFWEGATIFDGLVARTNSSGLYTVDRIEKTGTPGVFVGSYYSDLRKLIASPSGVSTTQYVGSVLGYSRDIRAAGNLVLSSAGALVNSSNLALVANLGVAGSPCLDIANQSAYIVEGNSLHRFDTVSPFASQAFSLPVDLTGDWSQTCVRWGLDGFAILNANDSIYIARWSATIPTSTDSNTNGLADAWEASYFGALDVDPAGDDDGDQLRNFQEYLFGTSPVVASENPMQVSTTTLGGQRVLRLRFPRRAGLSPLPYRFVTSSDLKQWTTAQNVSQAVLSMQTVGGIEMETVEATVPATNAISGFLRMEWKPQ